MVSFFKQWEDKGVQHSSMISALMRRIEEWILYEWMEELYSNKFTTALNRLLERRVVCVQQRGTEVEDNFYCLHPGWTPDMVQLEKIRTRFTAPPLIGPA